MTRPRHLIAAFTCAALLTLSAACSSASGDADGDVTLTFWGTYGNGGNTAQTDVLNKELIPAFEEANPGVRVKYVDIPYDSMKQKLTTGASGGQLPDLVRSDIGWMAQFGELGVYAALDEEMDDFDALADGVYPGTLAANAWGDHHYGLPLGTNTRVLVTSQQALDAAGLDAPPATFEEFKAMAQKLEGTNTQMFADSGLNAWNVLPWIWSGGGDITDPDKTTSSGYLDNEASVAAVQMLVDLYQGGQIPNLIMGNEGATATSDGLPKAEYATILDGPWMADIWAGQYSEFEPIYAPVPAGDGGSISVVGGESIALTTTSEHKEAAADFIRFTQSDTFQLGMANVGQMTVVPAFAAQQDELVEHYATFSEQLKTAKSRLAIPAASEVDTILSEELTPAFEGKTSVQEALSAAAQRIDPLLDGES
jgi:multiple sugar transport system substrate-binding protein